MAWSFTDSLGQLKTADPAGRGVVYSATEPDRTDVIWVDTSATDDATLVTSLPGSPYDGQIIMYQSAAMATDGIIWRFRYRAASASAYKWEFIGGAPLASTGGGGNVSTANNATFADPAGGTASVTVPVAGDYTTAYGARCVNNSSGNTSRGFLGLDRAGTNLLVDEFDAGTVLAYGVNAGKPSIRLNNLAASDVLKVRASTEGGINTNIYNPIVAITPVRVG